ncbi:MAG: hypothetical protein C4542_08095 [Dehalococcoidia bacterium]|nr:MAG: hypothetical protein C4542_08095 [Dehalococcoidia bacterium]
MIVKQSEFSAGERLEKGAVVYERDGKLYHVPASIGVALKTVEAGELPVWIRPENVIEHGPCPAGEKIWSGDILCWRDSQVCPSPTFAGIIHDDVDEGDYPTMILFTMDVFDECLARSFA